MEIVHTQQSRVHHFSLSLSVSRTVTRQRHNYIIRCTLFSAPLSCRRSRTCGTRNPMRARVPMGTGNEMVVTVSQPLRRWTAGMHPMMLSVGDCSLGHGDDTGPTGPPVAFVNTGNMLAVVPGEAIYANGPVGTEEHPDGLVMLSMLLDTNRIDTCFY